MSKINHDEKYLYQELSRLNNMVKSGKLKINEKKADTFILLSKVIFANFNDIDMELGKSHIAKLELVQGGTQ